LYLGTSIHSFTYICNKWIKLKTTDLFFPIIYYCKVSVNNFFCNNIKCFLCCFDVVVTSLLLLELSILRRNLLWFPGLDFDKLSRQKKEINKPIRLGNCVCYLCFNVESLHQILTIESVAKPGAYKSYSSCSFYIWLGQFRLIGLFT
jgi:hypothetical protein